MFELSVPGYGMMYRPWRRLFEGWRDLPLYTWGYEDWTPPSNITETEKHYVITMEVPGIDMKKTDISYREGSLTVRGEKITDAGEGEACVCSERFAGSFSRDFVLTGKIDEDKIDATYKDGVLKIILPKSEASLPKKIEIH